MSRKKQENKNIDIALFFALQEEYQVFSSIFPDPTRQFEDKKLSLTYFMFEIMNKSSTRTWRLLTTVAGAMGQTRSASITTHLWNRFHPDNIVVLGISGSLHKDVLLGDIVIPKTVENYLSLAAAVPDQDLEWKIETSGATFQVDPRLRNKVQNMESSTIGAQMDWECRANNHIQTSRVVERAIADGLMHKKPKIFAEDVNLASGDILGKAEAFTKWLRRRDRKVTAIDMETAGALELSALGANTRFHCIRAISDFADERKERLDSEAGGVFRKYAISNAALFLKAAVVNDMFDNQAQGTSISVLAQPPKLKNSFAGFLTEMEVELNNSHKDKLALEDVFVFPDLSRMNPQLRKEPCPPQSSSSFLDVSNLDKITVVYGAEQAGKTSLAKSLIKSYDQKGIIACYILANKVQNRKFARLITGVLRDQYMNVYLDSFLNPACTKVAIIDDFQNICLNKGGQQKFIEYMASTFDSVILISDLSVKMQDTQYMPLGEYTEYKIIPFGHVARIQLVQRWVSAGQDEFELDVEQSRRVDSLISHLNTIISRNLVPSKPLYILTVLQIFESSGPSNLGLTSYGFCYQHMIMQTFIRHGIKPRQTDALHNMLSELAYAIYKSGLYSLSLSEYSFFRQQYFVKYVFSDNDMLNTLEKIGIIINDGERVYFKYRFVYYFYCAKFLAENYNGLAIRDKVAAMCQQMYLDRNAHIIVFLTHHTKDQTLIDDILLNTMMRFSGVKEATLGPRDTIHFRDYEKLIPQLVLEERHFEEERKKAAAAQDMAEEEMAQRDSEDQKGHEHARAVDPKSLSAEISGCIRCVEIIGQILRNRYGSFSKMQLRELAEEAINASLRLLARYLSLSAQHKEEIIDQIRSIIRDDMSGEDAEVTDRAKKIFSSMCYWLTLAVLDRIASSVGCEELNEIFQTIADAYPKSIAMRLIHLSIKLQTQKRLPKDQVKSLYAELKDDLLGQRLLRQILLEYVYKNPVDYRDKQWISEQVGLPMRYQAGLLTRHAS